MTLTNVCSIDIMIMGVEITHIRIFNKRVESVFESFISSVINREKRISYDICGSKKHYFY